MVPANVIGKVDGVPSRAVKVGEPIARDAHAGDAFSAGEVVGDTRSVLESSG